MIRSIGSSEWCKHLVLWAVLVLSFFPLYLMGNLSLKDNQQFVQNPWGISGPFHWENYVIGWEHIGGAIFNTTFVAAATTVLTLALALGGAFFFARYRMPGSKFLFALFVMLMMYPSIANMIPMFKLLSVMGLYNTHLALILPAVAAAQGFNIYVLRNFIEEIPSDLFDAASIDGGGILCQLRHVVIPQTLPVIGSLGILSIIGQWNSFVAPLLYLRDNDLQMVSVALLRLEGEYTRNWGQLMAGYTIASIPLLVLFLFCMELFFKGLSFNENTTLPR